MKDFIGYSEAQIIEILGERFRDYRQALRFRQNDIAFQSGISVQTIRNFENGTTNNITLATFLKLLNAIGQRQNIDKVLPELPDIRQYTDNPPRRIKKRKYER